jgi:hypothetical protein
MPDNQCLAFSACDLDQGPEAIGLPDSGQFTHGAGDSLNEYGIVGFLDALATDDKALAVGAFNVKLIHNRG